MTNATDTYTPMKRIRAAALAILPLLAVSMASPALADSARSQDYFKDALEWLQKGDGRAALIQLRNAIKEDPDNFAARLLLGRLYLEARNLPAARKELEIAHAGAPSDESEVYLGQALLAGREFETVLRTVREQASDAAFQPVKRMLRAEALLGMQRLEEAAQEIQAILSSDPGHIQGNLIAARIKAQQSDYREAHQHIDKALATDPSNVDAQLMRARLYYAERDMDRAIEVLDKAIRLAPDDPRPNLLRAETLIRIGRLDDAVAAVDAFLKLVPNDARGTFLLARIYATQGKYEEADRELRKVAEVMRQVPAASLLAGTVKFQLGQYAQAEDLLQRYIRQVGAEARQARRLLATIQLRTLRPRAALETLAPLVAGESQDVASLQLAASASLRVRDLDQAKALFERIVQRGAPADVRQAQSFYRTLQSASSDVTGKLTLEPIVIETLIVLDMLRQGEEEEAVKEAQRLAAKHPANPTVANLLAGIYVAAGDLEMARKQLEPALAEHPDVDSLQRTMDRIDVAEGKFEAVEARLRANMADEPGDEAAILRLARFLAFRARQAEGVALLQEKLDALPKSLALRETLLRYHLATQQTDQARALAEEALAIGRDGNARGYLLAGDTYAALGDGPSAVDAYEQLVQSTNEAPAALLKLAQAQSQAGDIDGAAATLERVLAANPTHPSANQALVVLRLRQRDGDAAMAVAEKVAQQDPVLGFQLRAVVYHNTNRTDEAIRELRTALATYEVSDLAQQAFRMMVQANRPDEARELLSGWLIEHPDDLESLQLMSSLLIQEKDYEGAAAYLERAFSLLPNNPVVLNNLAWVRYQLERPGALAVARRAYRLASNAPAVVDTLGWILVREGSVEEGLKLLYTASGASPNAGDIAYHLAYALEKTGKTQEAVAVLERALAEQGEVTFDEEREAAEALLAKLKNG